MVFVLVQFIISANPTECLDVFDHFVGLALKKDCVSNNVHKTNQIIHLKTILKLQHGLFWNQELFYLENLAAGTIMDKIFETSFRFHVN